MESSERPALYGRNDMSTDKKAHCCTLGCAANAEWEIRWGNGPDDYIHACTDHVGVLLEAEKVNSVYPL